MKENKIRSTFVIYLDQEGRYKAMGIDGLFYEISSRSQAMDILTRHILNQEKELKGEKK